MPVPTVTAVAPAVGLAAGGITVTVTGTGFFNGGTQSAVTAVNFGATAATRINVTSDTSLTCIVPAHAVGFVDVTVVTPGGTSTTVTADQFTYEPTIAVQTPSLPGAVITFQAPSTGASGDTFFNDGRTSLRVKAGATGTTVTITGINKCSQGFLHNDVVTVALNTEETIGPFDPARFNDGLGMVEVTYSSTATITVAAVRS